MTILAFYKQLSHANKTRFWYLLWCFSKLFKERNELQPLPVLRAQLRIATKWSLELFQLVQCCRIIQERNCCRFIQIKEDTVESGYYEHQGDMPKCPCHPGVRRAGFPCSVKIQRNPFPRQNLKVHRRLLFSKE